MRSSAAARTQLAQAAQVLGGNRLARASLSAVITSTRVTPGSVRTSAIGEKSGSRATFAAPIRARASASSEASVRIGITLAPSTLANGFCPSRVFASAREVLRGGILPSFFLLPPSAEEFP